MKKGILISIITVSLIAILLSGYVLFKVSKNKIMISFITNDDKVLGDIEIIKGESINLPTPERDGYIFLGWFVGDRRMDDNYHFQKETSLNAKWLKEIERKTYTVKFDTTEKGSYAPNQIVKYGEKIKKPEIEINYQEGNFTKCGRCGNCPDRIIDWQLDGQTYDFNKPITSNITLMAVWDYVNTKC